MLEHVLNMFCIVGIFKYIYRERERERERERWWYTFMALSFTKHKNWCIRRCELWELYALKLTPFDILLY